MEVISVCLGIGVGWIVYVAVLVAGVILVKWGLWPRRRGTTPYCRACGYNLTGLTSEQCPECGHALAGGNVVYGRRHRRAFLAVLGILCVVLSVARLTISIQRVDWYQLKPTAWLIDDLQSASSWEASRAWRVLSRRFSRGSLSPSQRHELAELCLDDQKLQRSKVHNELMAQLRQLYQKGLLTAKQKERFFRQMITARLRVRPRIVVGDPIPCRVESWWNTGYVPMYVAVGIKSITLDGHPVSINARKTAVAHFYTAWSCPIYLPYSQLDLSDWIRVPVGTHKLRVVLDAQAFPSDEEELNGIISWDPARVTELGEPFYRKTFILDDTFEVFETEPPGYIKGRHSPAVVDALKNNFQQYKISIYRSWYGDPSSRDPSSPLPKTMCSSLWYAVGNDCDELPMNVVSDVFIRIGNEEIKIGTIEGRKGDRWVVQRFNNFEYDGPLVDSIDVILRSNEQLARGTIDMFEVWEGEAVIKDVPVTFREDGVRPPSGKARSQPAIRSQPVSLSASSIPLRVGSPGVRSGKPGGGFQNVKKAQ